MENNTEYKFTTEWLEKCLKELWAQGVENAKVDNLVVRTNRAGAIEYLERLHKVLGFSDEKSQEIIDQTVLEDGLYIINRMGDVRKEN